jgi:glycosyltransferase involved in cell wall biosynthesis
MQARAADVVVVGVFSNPGVFGLCIGSGRWLMHVFNRDFTVPAVLQRALAGLERRRPRGPRLTIAVPDPAWIPALERQVPGAAVACIPLAGLRDRSVLPGARNELGVPSGRPVVLVFGSGHGEQAPTTVVEALQGESEWQLLVVGDIASLLAFERAGWVVPPVRVPGPVSDRVRALAFEAADVVVLSFVAGYARRSGTLMDALSHERPVVVSAPSGAAAFVEEFAVGRAFAAGDASSLRDALRRVPRALSQTTIERLRQTWSNTAIARRHLEALADDPRSAGV